MSDYTKFNDTWPIEPDISREYGYLPTLDNEYRYGSISEWATTAYQMMNAPVNDLKTYLQNMAMHGKDFPVLNDVPYTWDYYLQKNKDGIYRFPLIKQKYDILQTTSRKSLI